MLPLPDHPIQALALFFESCIRQHGQPLIHIGVLTTEWDLFDVTVHHHWRAN
jgi:hypothetical protein